MAAFLNKNGALPRTPPKARLWTPGLLLLLTGCAAPLPDCGGQPSGATTVYLISHGWHTDLAIPAAELTGGLAAFRRVFPGLNTLVVGFGRRTFLIAPVRTFADLLIGPLPGNGALQVEGLSAAPGIAYDHGSLATLHPTPAQSARLQDAIWRSFRTVGGRPVAIAPGPIRGSVFYASTLGYSGLYTCNSWTADMLHRAGLPITPDFDVFASQTMARAAPLSPGGECRINSAAAPPAPTAQALPARSAG